MSTRQLLVYGAGGFGREVVWVVSAINSLAAQWEIAGFIDDDKGRIGSKCGELPVFGSIGEAVAALDPSRGPSFVSIGVGSPAARRLIANRIEEDGRLMPATLAHPSAVVGPDVVLGHGSIVTAGVIIGPNATIGAHVALNVACGVGHDATVSDFSVVCPGARVSGSCAVGAGVLVGSNAVIAPGRKVGAGAVVGALSFVVIDVPAGRTALGNPARSAGGGQTR